MHGNELIPIGELASRTGLSISAIRFYEARGLIHPIRNGGGQRRFLRADIRRLSFVMIAQKLGLSIVEIQDELARLPEGRTPTAKDWTAISRKLQAMLDKRIDALMRTRNLLDGCIGCGCLSLKKCGLYNPEDRAGHAGPGPRFVMET
jgi:MerR family redox-sensitive transcriptional activator SoxR